MKYKNHTLLLLLVLFSLNISAVPGTYYNSIDTNETCATFKTTLSNLISTGTTTLSYGSVDGYYDRTDSKPAETGGGFVIVDRYSSDIPSGLDSCNYRFVVDFCSVGGTAASQCVCYVKEHTFASSWFNDQLPMRSDMHLLFPADNYTNNSKSNYPLGYVQTPSFTSYNGTKIGTSNTSLNNGFSATHVFEPIDAFKGDFARAYLYVVTRYQPLAATWTFGSANDVLAGNTYPSFDPWILQLCVKWHKLDPPSDFERKRNDSIFAIQGNRNPYIDYPNWVEKVFGVNGNSTSCVASAVRNNKSIEFSVYPNPVYDGILHINLGTTLTEDATIEVIDIVGRKLIIQKINSFTQPIVDISKLVKGIYFLNLLYKDAENVSTFIKE